MKRMERLHALSEMLRRGGVRGCTAEQLASEFGVSMRTVKRDIDALENSGVPIWSRPGPGGGYGVSGRANLPPINLSSSQAVALLSAVSAAPDAPFSDLASSGIRKILDVLDPRTREKADQLARRVWVNREESATRAVRSVIEEAMAEQLVVSMRYTAGDGNRTTRNVEPVIFAYTNGRWYLIGWCQLRNEMRWFFMKRIGYAVMTQIPCSGHGVEEVGIPPVTSRSVNEAGEGQFQAVIGRERLNSTVAG